MKSEPRLAGATLDLGSNAELADEAKGELDRLPY
jgi:hypothetical protein